MNELRYTLLSDGSSDRALLPMLRWLLERNHVQRAIQPEWAELRALPKPPKQLSERILRAVQLFPCDLLFIHRDAERQDRELREQEIMQALQAAQQQTPLPPIINVIPIHMTEAWLLCDESAIRRASGNPHGRQALALPRVQDLENLPNPKQTLHNLLQIADGQHVQRRRGPSVHQLVHRVADLTQDFSRLRSLSAFQMLEADVQRAVAKHGWNLP